MTLWLIQLEGLLA